MFARSRRRLMLPIGALSGGGTPVSLALDGSGTTNFTGASATIALTTANGSGLIIVVVGSNNTNISTVTAPGLTFTQRAGPVSGGGSTNTTFSAPYSTNFSGNITVTQSGSPGFTTATAFGISGIKTSAPFDTNASVPTTGTTGTVSISTTAADTFIFFTYGSNQSIPGVGSGWKAINNSNFFVTGYQIVSSAQSGLTATVLTGTTLGGIIDAVVQGP